MQKHIAVRWWLAIMVVLFFSFTVQAQVNAVVFGRNRLQYKKFHWKFYQSPNFNTYVSQGGTELGKFVSKLAEEELPSLETFIEYSLQRKTDIVVYNSYDDYKQTNIGLGTDLQNAGGMTTLVNNKMIVYFDGNHNHLRQQIRQGIAKVLTDNLLFGEDIGEFAGNQALLDLPKWITDGYIAYAAEHWNTNLDNELRQDISSGDYTKFYQFAFKKPQLAGQAFWFYIAEKYKPESVSYFLYLARIYKSLNNASVKISKKKFKALLADFMEYEDEKYSKDFKQRKNNPKGAIAVTEDVSKNEYYRFQVNPNNKNNSYAVVEFKKGIYRVKLVEDYSEETTLLSRGVLTRQGDYNPNYPILAWDTKGTKLLVVYWEKGKTKMFVYDMISGDKQHKQTIEYFDQILDATFMLDPNTVVMSAVKNGHSDIYTYKIEEEQITQITNDVYDDLNPTFVAFPNRQGIVFSSNRPNGNAVNKDTVLPSRNRFNIYIVDIFNKTASKQFSQLTNLKYGNASFPMQYNVSHFTYISDENGVANRWAGFFSTQRNGLDTLYYVGEEIIRNPTPKELDSTLLAWQKQEPDSISYYQAFKDSTYSFPLTNYSSSVLETRIAGNNGQVSETKRDGDDKNLYKLKVNEEALRNRNVNAAPTEYMKSIIQQDKVLAGKATTYKKNTNDPSSGNDNNSQPTKVFFQGDFNDDKPDSAVTVLINKAKPQGRGESYLNKTKLFNYRYHFNADYVLAGLTNNILTNRYQVYQGGYGPIKLSNGNDLSWSFRVGASDLMEDIKFVGGFRFGFNSLVDKDVFFSFQNNRSMIDWGATYFRSTSTSVLGYQVYTNLYQANFTLPFNEVKSLRASIAYRTDRRVIKAEDQFTLNYPDSVSNFFLSHFEFVHDNTLNPTQNIWVGMRYKVYLDVNSPMGDATKKGKNMFNFGFDGRLYKSIYRNFIWAGRVAADFSWGKEKIVYFLGGVDGWVNPKFNNHPPAQDATYAFQSLAVNMRGYNQNVANGNNAFVINSEFRLPVFSTLIDKPINNAFIRNFQVIQFIDLGSAWNGLYNGIERPHEIYYSPDNNNVSVRIDAGGLGPFAGGYGFGVRSNLLGYFAKLDTAWPMKGVFRGKPIWYLALGFDF